MTNTHPDKPSDSVLAPAWDEERTIQRMGGHRALIEKLATLFIRDTPEQLSQASKGIDLQDYESSYIAMHSLKGTSSNFCTTHLEATCAKLLEALKQRDWPLALMIHHELSKEYLILEEQFKKFIQH
jgi:HPt (histidine-containing phosphotransfer) domain-containing protein